MKRSKLNIIYNGTDISENISDRLINFSYNDNQQGKADDIEITLQNRDNIWANDWYPDKGAKLKVGLTLENWDNENNNISVEFGEFAIDELSASSNGIFTIKAIASICDTSFKNEKKWKTWENVTIREVISSIASDNNLQLVWNAPDGETYPCIYQIEQTDAEFIDDKARRAGLKIKISEERLIIYNESIGHSGQIFTPLNLSSYSFKSKTFGIYDSCRVSYLDPNTNRINEYVHVDPEMPKTSVLVLDRQVNSVTEAKNIAKAELRKHNEKEVTASIETIGNPHIWSGQEITLKNFGVFDGVYILDSLSHKIDRSGYKTSAELNIKRATL